MASTGPAGTSPAEPNLLKEDLTMMRYAIGLGVVFLVIALIAALAGFGGVASFSWEGAKILFFVFLVLAVLTFLGGWFGRRSFGDQ
jgi:uncharacterized membrane protein YtjA (UPF0391 family)